MTTTPLTLDEVRDWCALDDGWRVVADDGNLQRTCWINEKYAGCPRTGRTIIVTKDGEDTHPHAATLDAAAAAMPEGWWWMRWHTPDGYEWVAGSKFDAMLSVSTPDTGNEVYDRYLLAREARLAMKGKA